MQLIEKKCQKSKKSREKIDNTQASFGKLFISVEIKREKEGKRRKKTENGKKDKKRGGTKKEVPTTKKGEMGSKIDDFVYSNWAGGGFQDRWNNKHP